MNAPIFDTHAHLQLPEFDRDRSGVIARSRREGVIGMLVLGVDADTSAKALALSAEHEGVYAAAGCHPHDAKDLTSQGWEEIETLARDSRVVAIGEIGLDFYRNISPRGVQIRVLERQLALAGELGKPVCVHCRDAHETMYPMLEAWSRSAGQALERTVGVMHYFSGNIDLARAYIELGFMISVHTSVTYPKSDRLQQVAAELPLNNIVVETDSPFGAPQSRRGERNEPSNAREAVMKVAELRRETAEAVAAATTANALRLFDRTGVTTQVAGSVPR